MTRIAIVGAGSVGTTLGTGFARIGHDVAYAVRNPDDPKYATLPHRAPLADATRNADVVVLAVPADAVPGTIPMLSLSPGQVVIDATNAVRTAVPGGHATMGELVAALVPDGVAVAKAFNTVGAEHLGNGETPTGRVFLPLAGDDAAVDLVLQLATDLGFEAVSLGGRDRFEMLEAHAKLWIHLAFGRGWGRQFAFTVIRP